jgi:hypothetical protein
MMMMMMMMMMMQASLTAGFIAEAISCVLWVPIDVSAACARARVRPVRRGVWRG